MSLEFPPRGTPAWDHFIEQQLAQHHTDIQRLWQTVPQTPEPQHGIAFTGPSSPAPFVTP